MSWNDAPEEMGGYLVYPTVVQTNPLVPRLTRLDPREAYMYALQTGEYRHFDTPEQAQAYAEAMGPDQGYKRDWNANIPNGRSFEDYTAAMEANVAKYGELYNLLQMISPRR